MAYLKLNNKIYQIIKETAKTYKVIDKMDYDKEVRIKKSSSVELFELVTLTVENCQTANTIIKIKNMEWGVKSFHYNGGQELNDIVTHIVGRGCNSSILSENEFHHWAIFSTK